MKTIKYFFIALVSLLASCSPEEAAEETYTLIGSWEIFDNYQGTELRYVRTFKEDGTLKLEGFANGELSFVTIHTYFVDGNVLTMESGAYVVEYRIEGNKLILTQYGIYDTIDETIYTRVEL